MMKKPNKKLHKSVSQIDDSSKNEKFEVPRSLSSLQDDCAA